MTEIKSCPFCGGEFISILMVRLNRRSGYRASCNGCGTTQGGIVHPSIEAAKEAWNRRAEPDQHPCCWAPSKALKELERGMNNAPCILTDAPAEYNDTPLYRDPAGTIAAQKQILTDLAEMLGVATGDVDGLITRVERVRKDAERYQFLKNIRVFRMFSADMSGRHTFATVGRPIGSGRNIDEAIDAHRKQGGGQ